MRSSSRKLDRLQATFDHEGLVANAGSDCAGDLDGPSGPGSLDRQVGEDRVIEAGPQDLDVGDGDDGRSDPYRSCEHVAGRGDTAGVAVQGDGTIDDRVISSGLHVRSHPSTRRRVESHAGSGVASRRWSR